MPHRRSGSRHAALLRARPHDRLLPAAVSTTRAARPTRGDVRSYPVNFAPVVLQIHLTEKLHMYNVPAARSCSYTQYTRIGMFTTCSYIRAQVASLEERTAGCQSNFYYDDLENLVRRKHAIQYINLTKNWSSLELVWKSFCLVLLG